MKQRVNILGVGVHPLNMELAIEGIESAMAHKTKGYVCVTGVHGIMEAQSDLHYRNIQNKSFLTLPDGMPTVWIGKSEGFGSMGRVYGPELMLEVMRLSVEKGYTHYFYGGQEGVAEHLKTVLVKKFPGLQVVGTYCPPFRPLNEKEEMELIEDVKQKKPDMFWVGISTPKQEQFMDKYINKLDVNLMFGVGAAFDVHTGRIKDAPDWMKESGLQWLHRLQQEPRRLWKRYLLNNPRFAYKYACQRTGFKKYKF